MHYLNYLDVNGNRQDDKPALTAVGIAEAT